MKKHTFLAILILLFSSGSVFAQSSREAETDSVILNRIDQWQDLKFGFMMHWGIYAQWGVVESWSICNEPWIDRNGAAYEQYKRDYWNLNHTFNPTQFRPAQMAAAAKAAGMKYMIFTTKHHDGFCMFNSNETEYSCTGPDCPYSRNAQPDITKSIVDAFREAGLWTGLYFSKADWHNDDYWAHEWATPDRNVNYDINEHPDRWDAFKTFTHKQVYELTHNYGDIDILWLDGGWIRPQWSINDQTQPWLGCYQRVQDIDMDKLVSIARSGNPDLIVVDRSVVGRYENYRTPEKEIPDSLPTYPWETCMTMGNSWSYVPGDNYKSTTQLIHILCDVVAKGGNLLLNVGPDAQGRLPEEAVSRMKEIGAWLDVNGRAIYATRPLPPYSKGGIRYTQSKDGSHRYAICLIAEPTRKASFDFPFDVKKVVPFAGSGVKASVKQGKDGATLTVSSGAPMYHAVVVEF